MKIFITCGAFFLCAFSFFCTLFIRQAKKNDDERIAVTEIDNTKINSHNGSEASCTPKINMVQPRWIPPGESITIAGKKIINGNFYFGNKTKNSCCSALDTSLIDDNLSIIASDKKYTDHSTCFYPKFSLLSPKCKGAYIDWLASDRTDVDVPMCYIYIYFYGLEHRIIFDYQENLVTDNEYLALFNELNSFRLLLKDTTFYQKATCLMEWMAINKPRLLQMPTTNLALIKNSLFFKYTLAIEAIRNKPISSDLALTWLWQSKNYSFNKKILKDYSIFANLFKKQYYKQFGDGVVVTRSDKRLSLTYKTSVNTSHSLPVNLLAAKRTKRQLSMLAQIADQCTDALLKTNVC
jgi:hypothetical protein